MAAFPFNFSREVSPLTVLWVATVCKGWRSFAVTDTWIVPRFFKLIKFRHGCNGHNPGFLSQQSGQGHRTEIGWEQINQSGFYLSIFGSKTGNVAAKSVASKGVSAWMVCVKKPLSNGYEESGNPWFIEESPVHLWFKFIYLFAGKFWSYLLYNGVKF